MSVHEPTIRAPDAGALLALWERGRGQSPAALALELLAAAADAPPPALAALSVGQRDLALLRLREGLFGRRMECVAACPACGERLELALDAGEMRAEAPTDGPVEVAAGEYRASLRLPTAGDLAELAALGPAATPALLLERCLLSLRRGAEELPPAELPAQLVAVAAAGLAAADPLAEVRLELSCPACAHGWLAPFDIVGYLWAELEQWAARTLAEIHLLATAYGWREAEILALSPARRRRYIEMVTA